MTGRAAGYCAGYPVPGFMNPGPGGYWGRGGRGGGRGWRNWFYATGLTGWQRAATGLPAFGGAPQYAAQYAAPYGPPSAPAMSSEQELQALKDQAQGFTDALEGIKKRIEELESEAKQETG